MTDQTVSHQPDHAGVRLPPPLIYVVIFGLGILLHLLVPLASLPVTASRVAAIFFLVVGVSLTGSALLRFRHAHTSLVPIKPTTALVFAGPYRLTRNPMYLGLLCMYIAFALWFGLIWPLVLVPLVVLAVQRLVIAKEERYLEQKFGDAYRQYQAQVRRWI